jgi:hypothetical protein
MTLIPGEGALRLDTVTVGLADDLLSLRSLPIDGTFERGQLAESESRQFSNTPTSSIWNRIRVSELHRSPYRLPPERKPRRDGYVWPFTWIATSISHFATTGNLACRWRISIVLSGH